MPDSLHREDVMTDMNSPTTKQPTSLKPCRPGTFVNNSSIVSENHCRITISSRFLCNDYWPSFDTESKTNKLLFTYFQTVPIENQSLECSEMKQEVTLYSSWDSRPSWVRSEIDDEGNLRDAPHSALGSPITRTLGRTQKNKMNIPSAGKERHTKSKKWVQVLTSKPWRHILSWVPR
jgi:hypothetical protein